MAAKKGQPSRKAMAGKLQKTQKRNRRDCAAEREADVARFANSRSLSWFPSVRYLLLSGSQRFPLFGVRARNGESTLSSNWGRKQPSYRIFGVSQPLYFQD
jgi:hypothetical protein